MTTDVVKGWPRHLLEVNHRMWRR